MQSRAPEAELCAVLVSTSLQGPFDPPFLGPVGQRRKPALLGRSYVVPRNLSETDYPASL